MTDDRASAVALAEAAQRLVIACARYIAGDAPESAALRGVGPGHDWDATLALAGRHGLTPMVYAALSDCATQGVPTPVLAKLWAHSVTNARRNSERTRELLRLLPALERAGVAALPLKGPALAASLYSDPGLRVYGDLDILVKQSDVLRARGLLESEGYRLAIAMSAADENAFLRSARQYDFELVHEQTGDLVELHWKTNPQFTIERLGDAAWWAALERVPVADATALSMNARETLFVLLIHGSKHLWERLCWLVDIALLGRKLSATDWDWLIEQSRQLGCTRRVGLGLSLAQELFGLTLPHVAVASLCDSAVVRSIKNRIFEDAMLEAGASMTEDERLRLDLRLYDTVWQRLACGWRLLIDPNAGDWSHERIHRETNVLFFLRRWWRLAKKYGPLGRGTGSR